MITKTRGQSPTRNCCLIPKRAFSNTIKRRQRLKNPQRGEVWVADLGMVAKTRSCLILSVPLRDEDRALIGIVPHTTQPRGTRFEINTPARFLKPGVFDAQGLQPVPLAKLERRFGALTAQQMQSIGNSVRQWLAL